MAGPVVSFAYYPGVDRLPAGIQVDLCGSWAPDGTPGTGTWSRRPMARARDDTGALCFTADVSFDPGAVGASLSWGTWVRLGGGGAEVWGVAAEVPDLSSTDQVRTLIVASASADGPQRESYRLCWHRARGAQRYLAPPAAAPPALGFSAWAPDATAVEVVSGQPSGYIADGGYGADPGQPTVPLSRGNDGIWTAVVPDFGRMVGAFYMYRISRPGGSVNWATDMFSRQQCGLGDFDPGGAHYDGPVSLLDGRPSCSVVTDPDIVAPYPADLAAAPVSAEQFWRDEFDPARPVPDRVEDLVIYELHVGGLDPATTAAGTFTDAIDFLPYLEDLRVNAIELMPMFQFDGSLSWGYGSSQFLAIESAAGGRDALKHFVKACHQHGIAVIMDVVYNHYTNKADRA